MPIKHLLDPGTPLPIDGPTLKHDSGMQDAALDFELLEGHKRANAEYYHRNKERLRARARAQYAEKRAAMGKTVKSIKPRRV